MSHALTANLGMRDFYAAFFTNNTAMLEALVFATEAFIVTDRTEQLGTEQAITLRFKRSIVNGFRFFHLTK
jgi:hypothetical protein